ncbi:MAG: MFS transporter [Bradymonadaceae bacterium]
MGKDASKTVYRDPNLLIVFAVTLTAVMGVSSITPAFPKIAEALEIRPQQTGLLITLYYAPGIVLSPVLGFLADRYGRKPILTPSLFLFGIAGASCALVRDFETLLILRFLQGMGAGALGALNLTIIGDLFDGDRLTEAMGYNASVLSVGTAAYPTIGGALALLGWYMPFVLPLVAIPTGLLVMSRLDSPEPEADQQLGEYLSAFLTVVRQREALVVFALSMVTFAILFGPYLAYFPILMDETFGVTTFVIGIVMSSVSVASGITAARLGEINRRFSQKSLLVVAFVLYTVTFASLPYLHSIWAILVPSATYGIAQGLNIPTLQSLLAGMAPMEQRAMFMSFSGLVRRIGQTFGPVVAGGLYAAYGFEGVYLGAAGLTGVSLIVVVWGVD